MATAFELHPKDGVDPKDVPKRKLANGMKMPAIGLGTYSNDKYTNEEIAQAVTMALSCGYRFIDCASIYGNEAEIGVAIENALADGLNRDELFVSSKLWNGSHAPEQVRPAIEKSLADLRLKQLDLYYIHWPFPNTHEAGASPDSRDPNAKPYDPEAYLATYRELEKALDDGLIRAIGTSNMTVPKLRLLLPEVRHRPVVNQMEMHPCFAQNDFFTYLLEEKMVPVAFCPLGSPERPERDTTLQDVAVMKQPVIVQMAKKHGVHPAQICLKWAVQRGQIPIPSSILRQHIADNIKAVVSDPLGPEEMVSLATINCDCRLIKGQVFLWETATSWKDLWDEDGQIKTGYTEAR